MAGTICTDAAWLFYPSLKSASVACFALMPNAQDSDQILLRIVSIECEVPRRCARDHQLAPIWIHAAPDLGMTFEDFNRATNALHGSGSGLRRVLEQMLDNAFEVGPGFGGIDYPRHRTGLGRFATRPRALAVM